jgi:DNA mismatch repair ATPase MutS
MASPDPNYSIDNLREKIDEYEKNQYYLQLTIGGVICFFTVIYVIKTNCLKSKIYYLTQENKELVNQIYQLSKKHNLLKNEQARSFTSSIIKGVSGFFSLLTGY